MTTGAVSSRPSHDAKRELSRTFSNSCLIDMHKLKGILGLAMVGLTVTACSSTPNCLERQAYTDAVAFPKLQAPAGLEVPASDDQMTIPEVRNGPVAAFNEAPAGTEPDNDQSRCLTTPPVLQTS